MLDHGLHDRSVATTTPRERFLRSSSGALGELKQLLMDSREPIEPATGAQIAQMLRAIREGATTHGLDRIAHDVASIEMHLTSSEAYGPGNELRNFVLGSQVEELRNRFAERSAGVLATDSKLVAESPGRLTM